MEGGWRVKTSKFFSATTDMWSTVGLKPYMSYTLDYFDSDWTLQNRCLQTQLFHAGGNITEAMKSALDA